MCFLSPKIRLKPVCQPTTALHTSLSLYNSFHPCFKPGDSTVLYHTVYLNKQASHRRNFKFCSTSRSEKQMLKMNWKYKGTSELWKCNWNFRKKEKESPLQTTHWSNYLNCTLETKGSFSSKHTHELASIFSWRIGQWTFHHIW